LRGVRGPYTARRVTTIPFHLAWGTQRVMPKYIREGSRLTPQLYYEGY